LRRLSHASLNDSSKTKLTPTATANETRSPRGRARAKMLATVPKMRPTARLPNTRRSSNSVWSTWGRSKRRSEAHRITKPGRIPTHETAAGPGSEWHLGEGRGRSPAHLHELRRFRRRGRRKVPSVCGRVRGGAGAARHGGGHPGSGPVPHMRRGQRSEPRGM